MGACLGKPEAVVGSSPAGQHSKTAIVEQSPSNGFNQQQEQQAPHPASPPQVPAVSSSSPEHASAEQVKATIVESAQSVNAVPVEGTPAKPSISDVGRGTQNGLPGDPQPSLVDPPPPASAAHDVQQTQQQTQQSQEQHTPGQQGSLAGQGGQVSGQPGTSDTPNNGPSSDMSGDSSRMGAANTWDKAKMLFSLTKPEELLNDLHDLKYIGAGGYGKVFKAVWRSAPVAVKLVPSHSPELFKSSSYKEALLCKELCHPNIVQTYETRCAQLSDEFVQQILSTAETPLNPQMWQQGSAGAVAAAAAAGAVGGSYGSQEFVSGDGFGLPSPVPDMLVRGKTLPEAAAKWKDILFTTGAKAGDFLTVIIMDYCDYGSLVRPILKGMFRPISASGSDREARVRYRALLRTAKEIAQGLEHLHHLRVVHGDLKPGNVLLKGSRVDVRGFNAQVIDFGLSHMVCNSNPQKVSKAGGTLVYAAPEVFSGQVGKAADVYSLGIILWEMVTGSQPYKDLVEGQIVLGVQKGGLRPAWPQGQLPELQALYEKCVAQDPETRPKAKEVVQLLTQIEMDLRSELKAAHKQQQQQHTLAAQQQAAAVAQQQAAVVAAQQAMQAHAVAAQQLQHQQQQAALAAAAAAAGGGVGYAQAPQQVVMQANVNVPQVVLPHGGTPIVVQQQYQPHYQQ